MRHAKLSLIFVRSICKMFIPKRNPQEHVPAVFLLLIGHFDQSMAFLAATSANQKLDALG